MNVKKYEEMGLSHWQLEEIKIALRNGIDSAMIDKFMANSNFDNLQMEQIRLGLEAGIDVSHYAREGISYHDMQHFRKEELQRKIKEDSQEEKEKKILIKKEKEVLQEVALRNTQRKLKLFLTILIIALICSIPIVFKETIRKQFATIELELVTKEIEINVGEVFEAEKYIKLETKGEDIYRVLPSVDTNEIQEKNVEYILTNSIKTVKRKLRVKVVDKEKPTITLKESEVELYRDERFIAEEYIKEVSDNYSSDLPIEVSEINHDKDRQEIIYKTVDSSGNEGKAILVLYWKDRPKVIPTPNVEIVPAPSNTTPISEGGAGGNLPPSHGTRVFRAEDYGGEENAWRACESACADIYSGSCECELKEDSSDTIMKY